MELYVCTPPRFFCGKGVPRAELSERISGHLSGAPTYKLRYYICYNQTYVPSKLWFPPHAKEFPRKSFTVWPTAHKNFASPVSVWKISKNIGFKWRQFIILPGKPTCLGPALTTVLCRATVHTLLAVTVFMFKYYKHGDVTTFCNSIWQLPSNMN